MSVTKAKARRLLNMPSSFGNGSHLIAGVVIGLLLGLAISSLWGPTGATEPPARLVAFSPSPSATVPLDAAIMMEFSDDVVDQDQVGSSFSADILQTEPTLKGEYVWQSPRKLRLILEEPLAPSTRYSGVADLSLVPVSGGRIEPTTKPVEFSTPRLAVTGAHLSTGDASTSGSGDSVAIDVQFNYTVDVRELRVHTTLTDSSSGSLVRYTLVPDEGSATAFTLIPDFSTGRPTSVTLSIDSDLTCIGGSLGLVEDFTQSFQIPSPTGHSELRVNWFFPTNYYASPGTASISIGFSDTVDVAAFKQATSIEPSVPYSVTRYGRELLLISDQFRPGEVFTVAIQPGLVSVSGRELIRGFTGTVVMPDLDPRIEFDDPGMYLPRHNLQAVAVSSTNIEEVEVAVYQIFRNNLTPLFSYGNPEYYLFEDHLEVAGQLIEVKSIKTSGQKNTEEILHVDLSQYETPEHSGVYGVIVRDKYNRWRSDSRLIVTSDLGIVFKASENDLLAFVCSIESLEPVAGATVTVLSSNNQEISVTVTDSTGIARFEGLRSTLSKFSPFMVVVDSGSDFSFLPLDLTEIDLVDFDVTGRSVLQQGYEAFVYMDRDLFRPGDTAHVAGIVRGPDLSVPQSFPAQLVVYDPGGGVFREIPVMIDEAGSFEISLDIQQHAMTGGYLAALLVAGKEIGRCEFMVEDFVPERIKVNVKLDSDSYLRGTSARVEVSAESLLGSKLSGRDLELAVLLRSVAFSPSGFASYRFTDSSREYTQPGETIVSGTLSEAGNFVRTHRFASDITPPSAIEAVFRATVTEVGGRSSQGSATAVYHPYERYVGVRLDHSGYAELGKPIAIDSVVVGADGVAVGGAEVKVEVYTVQWSTTYSLGEDGRYRYDIVRHEDKVFEQLVRTDDSAKAELLYTPSTYGSHKVVVLDASASNGHRAAIEFYVTGGFGSMWSGTNPDEVTLEPDSVVYRPGSIATVRITSPFAGKGLITVERERVFRHFVVDVPEGLSEISIPVTSEYVPNVYITAQIIRSPKGLDKLAAVRAFGTTSISVETGRDELDVKISAPDTIKPSSSVDVQIQVVGKDGAAISGQAVVTLAAVDEGICQITGYDVPSPLDFFYGRKQLSVKSYDLYRMLLSEPRPVTSPSSVGGDMYESVAYGRERYHNPVNAKRVEPVSLWSGLVKTDSQGRATITLDIPEFSGTLRLMAVAASGRAFGGSSKLAMVQDDIVVTTTLPRFASTGDSFDVPVSVRNETGKAGSFTVELSASGSIQLAVQGTRKVQLDDGEEALLIFRANALSTPGTASIKTTVSGNGAKSSTATQFAVQPATPYTTTVTTGTVTASEPVTLQSAAKFVDGTASYSITIGALPTAQLGTALQYLVRYPYGCLEQTTSSCFPLLYYKELAAQTDDRLSLTDVSAFVERGIDKIESMQLQDGSFAYWPGSFSRSLWSSIYASHFLVEARAAGYLVSERVYTQMLRYLETVANRKTANADETQCRIYAIYVLSLAGQPSLGNLAYLKRAGTEGLPAFSRAQLAAALALAGDKEGARTVAPDKLDAVPSVTQTGSTFRSPSRDDAVMLHALVTADPTNPAVYALSKRLIESIDLDGTWGATQSTAFALLALGKAAAVYERSSFTGTIKAGRSVIAEFSSSGETMVRSSGLASALTADGATIEMKGEGTAYYALTVSGVPLSPAEVKESDKGIKVRREYLTRDGKPVDVTALRQGDVIIAHITVTPIITGLENVVIVDMLPAGLEIENPRLQRDTHLTWTETDILSPDYMDIRDDRMILFATFRNTRQHHFYYAVRAVTVGEFTLPPITAECMYDPSVSSVSGAGSVTVKE